jgi:hypothetical protein
MKKKYMLLLVTMMAVALLSSVTVATFPPWTQTPRLDKQLFQVIKGADAEVDALVVSGIVDFIPGPGTTPRINRVLAWGGNMSYASSASYAFGALQCRDVWPPEAAGGPEGVTPGQTCSPMNYSGFRVALSYIFDMASKAACIYSYVQGPQTFAIQSIIPPAQAYWYDPTATQPASKDYAGAWAWLQADGFYVDSGILYDSNGVACRDLKCYYGAGATAWQIELPSFVAAFNDFMDNYLGVTNCNLVLLNKDFATLVYDDLMTFHDTDMAFLGLTGLGPDPDWTISMFSSEYGGVGGWNFPGVNDEYIDHIMDIILHEVDVNKIRAAVYDFQHYYNGEITPYAQAWFDAHPEAVPGKGFMPHFIWSSGLSINSFNPHIENYIDMPCWGSEQCAEQWMFTAWDVGYTPAVPGTIRRCLGDEPTSINPFYENTLYGWLLMDGLEEGLLTRNPQTLEIQPWLAKDFYYEGPINTTTPSGKNIVNGMKITFLIREGIYWQDSGAYKDANGNGVYDAGDTMYTFPFTAYDCQFAANMFMKYHPGRYDTVWTDMIETATEGPYKFSVWYNASSYWYSTYPSAFGMFPEHIYAKADAMVDNGTFALFSDFKPFSTSYTALTGLHPPDAWGAPPAETGYWTALIGTGPYLFGYYNPSTLLGSTIKNPNYWAGESPVLQSLETCGENYHMDSIEGHSLLYREVGTSVITLDSTWHIDGWKDLNHDTVVSVGDEVTLSKMVFGNDIWVGQGDYSVVSMAGSDVATVKAVSYTPKMLTTAVVADLRSMVWNRGGGITWNNKIDVKLDLYCDDVLVGTATSLNVAQFEKRYVTIPITSWTTISLGKHTFRVDFSVRTATTGSVPYTYVCSTPDKVLIYFPGDANNDGVVNMQDIYTYGIKNFLIDNTLYGWNNLHDASGTLPGSLKAAKSADVTNDGIVNMVDIYRMIIQFMKSWP